MDGAYVEPNEPQMIDIVFIRSEHVRATRFFGEMIDFISKKKASVGFHN